MKLVCLIIPLLSWLMPAQWEPDMVRAQKNAREQHKAILLNFSGSDWCAPCIKMHKEIFNADDFSQWANQHLILVNADFPREKKHQLPKNIQEQNNRLADSYNPKGVFPFTVLIDENGIVLRSWEGYPKTSPPEFIQELSATLSTNTKNNAYAK